ncbi:MAG: tyrosine-type recombinase/integrase [Nanoarchaeota archaeon]|nr:tyrosine-type recombinase/integrase [Nanoarchaeota archaeon]
MKIDPYKHRERYLAWKEKVSETGIQEVSKKNSNIIIKYLNDMELGLNVSSKNTKGSRSYLRLNSLKQRLIFMSRQFENRYKITDLTKLTEIHIHDYFSGMRNGSIKRQDGSVYKSVVDFVKIFKAFWHWHQKICRKQKIDIEDITVDLDTSNTKPEWVYLDESQIKKLYNNAKPEYKELIMFLFDTGIRAPTEFINIKVSDLMNDCKELNIREEVSKTFGRRIKLMICSEILKEYIQTKELQYDDYLFSIDPRTVNQYIKRLAKRTFGEKRSLAGQKYSELTMQDFRHISCCYWLPRYKSESALKFRFGWKKSDKINYYSELL